MTQRPGYLWGLFHWGIASVEWASVYGLSTTEHPAAAAPALAIAIFESGIALLFLVNWMKYRDG